MTLPKRNQSHDALTPSARPRVGAERSAGSARNQEWDTVDTFEEFERRQRSFDLIDQHRSTLATEAARIAKEHPRARIVGVIVEADAPEAAAFLRLLAPDAQPVNGFVGVVPRHLAV